MKHITASSISVLEVLSQCVNFTTTSFTIYYFFFVYIIFSLLTNIHYYFYLKNSSSKVKTIYTASYGTLTFRENGRKFSLHKDDNGDILPVPSAIWRLVSIKEKSIVFIVINDIFYYFDENKSPFKKEELDIIGNCDCKTLGYNNLNEDETKPFVFCCNAKKILEHEMYKDIFEDKDIATDISESPKIG